MKPIIKIENLSKQYRLGTIGTGTLTNDLGSKAIIKKADLCKQ